jgi:hypothetical protein
MSPYLLLQRRSKIDTYIRAKDTNRPHLMQAAFTHDAVLNMSVKANTISFPKQSVGVDLIADVLVRQFGARYENVYTFCIGQAPIDEAQNAFVCDWVVCMSEKSTGNARFGYGSYIWHFSSEFDQLVDSLHIHIEEMFVLPPSQTDPIMDWASALPYPWCDEIALLEHLPEIRELETALSFLNRKN